MTQWRSSLLRRILQGSSAEDTFEVMEFRPLSPGLAQTMRRALLLCALLLAAATVFGQDAKPATVEVTISGMHCDGCAVGITAMLKRTEGVLKADVSFEEQRATVDYDRAKTSVEKIIETIEKLGYKVAIKK